VALLCALSCVLLCTLFVMAAEPPAQDRLWEHRNLGKAFYENPDTHVQAVGELKEALRLSGALRDRINYGLALLRAGQTEAGMTELIAAQKEDSKNPHTWFNLGIAYKHAGDYDRAIEQFQGMLRLVPNEAVAHYNLASVLRSKGDSAAAIPEFLEAEKLSPDLAGPHFQLFSLYQRAGNHDAAARERQAFEDVKKRTVNAAVPEDMEWSFYVELDDPPEPRPAVGEAARYEDRIVSRGWRADQTHLLLLDTENTGRPDLLAWSPERVVLLKHGSAVADAGLEGLRDVRSIEAGDYDNDGWPDLCVLTGAGATVFHNDKGHFSKTIEWPAAAGATRALWLDFDHDYDLDLLLFGPHSVLLRNDGGGKFEDRTAAFPFVNGQALDAALTAVRVDTAARDVAVSYADRAGVMYRDRLNGVFEASDLAQMPANSENLTAQDFDHDGLLDLVSYRPQRLALRNQAGIFAADGKAKTAPAAALADFNGDQHEDYAAVAADGNVHLFLNETSAGHWMTVRMQGVKNGKQAVGATVEMKAGAYYEKKV
jgi:hypothetical protein